MISRIILGAILGSATGSFMACCAWRIPRRESLTGRSQCPGCGEPVPGWLNVPVLAWIVLRGRARCCGNRLAIRYLVFESACLAAGAGAGTVMGVVGLWVAVLVVMVICTVISWLTRRA